MISYLKGKIIELDFTFLTILTESGVGYEVGINQSIYNSIISNNSLNESISPSGNFEIELYIYHHLTENSQSLFGFLSQKEKKVFKELIKISGIGGKLAMQILSIGIDELISAVGIGDNKSIESVKGVGKKMAEKIIIELKDKDFGIEFVSSDSNNQKENRLNISLYEGIKSTLVNMGYNLKDVDKLLKNLPENLEEAGEILQYIIKELS